MRPAPGSVGDIVPKGGYHIGHRGHAAVVKRVSRPGILVLGKPRQRITKPIITLAINLPSDARRLQPLGISRPRKPVGRHVVVDRRSAARAIRVNRAGEQVEPVWKGWAHHRAIIGVANGVGISQRIIKRQITPGVISHGNRAIDRNPLVPVAQEFQTAVRRPNRARRHSCIAPMCERAKHSLCLAAGKRH